MANWSKPLPLITCHRNNFRVESQTIRLLQEISKPFAVVCIAGIYRTGKSYLMNRLLGKRAGFALGNTVEAKTKGIWVWYRDHPNDANKGLLVMDTEGLDDPDKGDETNDLQILSMSILLSSTFIYNIVGKLDNTVIDKLDFVTELSKHVRVKSNAHNDSDFDSVFPNFVLVCRDKILELKMNGKEVTADEYMKRVMLTPKENVNTDKEMKRNEIKLKLRKYFRHRKCFFLVRPAKTDEDMLRLEELSEKDLQVKFLTESNELCSYIHTTAPVKKLGNQNINGKIFANLTKIYVDAINSDIIPSIDCALDLIASTENAKLIDECFEKYRKRMLKLVLPVSISLLNSTHEKNYQISVDFFNGKVFADTNGKFLKKLEKKLTKEYWNINEENSKESEKICNEILDDLYAPIVTKLRNGNYFVIGGYNKFMENTQRMCRNYKSSTDNLINSEKVLNEFESQLANERKMILTEERKLEKLERERQEAKRREERAQREYEQQQQEIRRQQEEQAALIWAQQEHMRQIEAKHRAQLEAEERRLRLQTETCPHCNRVNCPNTMTYFNYRTNRFSWSSSSSSSSSDY